MNGKTTKEFDDFKKARLYFTKIKQQPVGNHDAINDATPIGIIERHAVTWFYKEYSRYFGLNFLAEKARRLSDGAVKVWIVFCIKNVKQIKYSNEDFDNALMEFSKYADMSYNRLISIFSPYKPFFFQCDFFKFAYDNIDSPTGSQFFVLLMMWIDSNYPVSPRFDEIFHNCRKKYICCEYGQCIDVKLCTLERQKYNKDNNFDDIMMKFERELIDDFINQAPIQNDIRDKALPFILKMFERINKTGRYRDKLPTSLLQIYDPKDLPLTGNIIITWDKVDFYDGFYLIQHPKTSYRDTSKVYSIRDANSRKVFNEIGGYFLKKLQPIYVEFMNGFVQRILNKSDLSSVILTMEHKVSAPTTITKKKGTLKPSIQIEFKELSKAEAKAQCMGLKSRYLDYLANAQLEDYKVICSIENRVNASNYSVKAEYSFIFTIKRTEGYLYLAYENVQNSRCTYIFPIPWDMWQISIDTLYDFFASNEANKRQSLANRIIDLKLPFNYEYKRIMHTDNFLAWVNKIKHHTSY